MIVLLLRHPSTVWGGGGGSKYKITSDPVENVYDITGVPVQLVHDLYGWCRMHVGSCRTNVGDLYITVYK